MSRPRRVLPWHCSGWLPGPLEVAEWPRLERHRLAHEAAVADLDAARRDCDAGVRDAATLALCDVTEAALVDLAANIEEADEAHAAAAPTVRPKTTARPPTSPDARLPGATLSYDEQNARAAEINGRITAEQGELRPRRRALERDHMAMNRVRRHVEANVLHDAGLKPTAQGELENERKRIGAMAEAGPTLEQRVAELEAERSTPAEAV